VDRLQAFLLADDDERRAIERALHDGVQQQLVAIAVQVQLARRLVDEDPSSAAHLLDEVRIEVGRALEGVRTAAGRVHPPLLDSQGLVAALRMAAAAAPVPTRVEEAVERPVPAPAAVTLYRCCVAALAAGGGEGAHATVIVRTTDEAVDLEVRLEGARADEEALDLLGARVQAFGGALDVHPHRVAVRMPLTS